MYVNTTTQIIPCAFLMLLGVRTYLISWTLRSLKGNALIRMDTLTARFTLNHQIHINYCTKTRSIPNIPSQVATTTILQDMNNKSDFEEAV